MISALGLVGLASILMVLRLSLFPYRLHVPRADFQRYAQQARVVAGKFIAFPVRQYAEGRNFMLPRPSTPQDLGREAFFKRDSENLILF